MELYQIGVVIFLSLFLGFVLACFGTDLNHRLKMFFVGSIGSGLAILIFWWIDKG